MARVLVAGVAVADFVFNVEEFPRHAEKYRAHGAAITGGGCAANAAVAIERHDGEALLAARLGDDAVGDLILAGLAGEGVDTTLVNRSPGGLSSFSSVYVDQAGERQIVNFRGSGLAEASDWLDGVSGFDAVLADNRWPPLTRKALAIARENGVPGIVDGETPAEPDDMKGASHIAFSMQGLRALQPDGSVEAALKAMASATGAWVCVTDGANGVHYLDGQEIAHVPAIAIDAVDTLGAGDIWHGVFALRLAEGAGEHDAIVFANAAATLKCLTFGGREGCPRRAETLSFLKENGQCI